MCDQTEINYLDGDVVWVKLSGCWWPGQVTGVDNLPDDLKVDFEKKPPIAAVKFFQENSYEFVKNFHQIYKYNCTQKDEFIRKGLDKHRSKRKDGSSYMDKFPGDVEMAERLTGGDPGILKSEKFSPEEKPDISSLFGEKKIPKKKHIKSGEGARRSQSGDARGKIISNSSRLSKENDHEVRIRHQPTSHPSTPYGTNQQVYSCPLCNFTTTRVNVLICHNKSHRGGGVDPTAIVSSAFSKSSSYTQPKRRSLGNEMQKRKYVRKNKSLPKLNKTHDEENEPTLKRKQQKQSEKIAKKKKSDPEIKELLADWDDGSEDDDDMNHDLNKSSTNPTLDDDVTNDVENYSSDKGKSSEMILKDSEKLLKDTETLSTHMEISKICNIASTDSIIGKTNPKHQSPLMTKVIKLGDDTKLSSSDCDQEKKSKLSCFDFEEEEPEPAITPVRKIPRVFGEKNTSLKKELIKEFTLSQALANENQLGEKEPEEGLKQLNPDPQRNDKDDNDKLSHEIMQAVNEADELVAKIASETALVCSEETKKDGTEMEIVEILEIEREKQIQGSTSEESVSANLINDNNESNRGVAVSQTQQEEVDKFREEHKNLTEVGATEISNKEQGEVSTDNVIEGNTLGEDVELCYAMENEKMSKTQSKVTDSDLSTAGNKSEVPCSQSGSVVASPPEEDYLTINEEANSQAIDKPIRRRGRPRKYPPLPIQEDVLSNTEDSVMTINPILSSTTKSDGNESDDKKLDIKMEVDGERSYKGRTRKPNKKYIESEIYSTSPGRRTPKTDDSQSETEDHKNISNKELRKRRNASGTKKSGLSKRIGETLEENDFSDHTHDSAEESSAGTPKPIPKSPKKPSSEQTITTAIVESGIVSPVKITDLLATTVDVEISSDKPQLTKENSGNIEIEDDKKIDMLPPKKSQIKKFELSQIDSSGNYEEGDTTNQLSCDDSSSVEAKEIIDGKFPQVDDDQSKEKIATPIDVENRDKIENEKVEEETIENIIIEEVIEEEEPDHEEENQQSLNIDGSDGALEEKQSLESSTSPDNNDTTESGIDVGILLSNKTSPPGVGLLSPQQNAEKVPVPVKKREKPRIIENVTLKEPMQILKSKLLENKKQQQVPSKGAKHKLLETDEIIEKKTLGSPVDDNPKTKIMKFDSDLCNISENSVMTECVTANEKIMEQQPHERVNIIDSQNFQDMELDINSIPFVLSEDLNPDSIGQMPVIMSALVPSSHSTDTIISTESASKQTPNPIGSSSSIGTDKSPVKKKTASPTILKSRAKAKPTITSIKTLVPPLTGGVKNLKFQTPQGNKAAILTKKTTPGKYVIVQASSGQQIRYTIQGNSAIQQSQNLNEQSSAPISQQQYSKPQQLQKIASISNSSKAGTGNPQIVQQGGKVVIITSPQSGQTKMLPLGIQKTGLQTVSKVQKLISTKGQVFSQISPKTTMIIPKSVDTSSSVTASKLTSTCQKIVNTGVLTSKGLFTPISGTKTILTTIPQQLLTKTGVITQISPQTQIAGKSTVMGQKAIMTSKGTFFTSLPSTQGGTTKTILAPISQASLAGKTLITNQGLVSGKGAILTPFTGQQVKAMATAVKSPAKSTTKFQYQAVQQKVQMPMIQKKVPISSAQTLQKINPGALKSSSPGAGGTMILQTSPVLQQQQQQQQQQEQQQQPQQPQQPAPSPVYTQVVPMPRKMIRQTSLSSSSPPSSIQSKKLPQSPVLVKKSKTAVGNVTMTPQKIKQPKQKIAIDKFPSSSVETTEIKVQQSDSTIATTTIVKATSLQNHKKPVAAKNSNISKVQTCKTTDSELLSTSAMDNPSSSLFENHEKNQHHEASSEMSDLLSKMQPSCSSITDNDLGQTKAESIMTPVTTNSTTTKCHEQKSISGQPQIMALPTESADGTQSYVLVTIDEQGQIQPLDNSTFMSLEGTTVNPDGSRTLYIDPSSLDPSGTLDNIVLHIDNNNPSNSSATTTTGNANETLNEVFQASNQDILAAALANSDFQHEIGLSETATSVNNSTSSCPGASTSSSASSIVINSSGISQTSLDTQTILQSTLIPSTEPISSPSVLETSLTLNQPIMTPLEVPSGVATSSGIESENSDTTMSVGSSLELTSSMTFVPTCETNVNLLQHSMPDIGEIMGGSSSLGDVASESEKTSSQYMIMSSLDSKTFDEKHAIIADEQVDKPIEEQIEEDRKAIENVGMPSTNSSDCTLPSTVAVTTTNVIHQSQNIQQTTPPSMPIIDDSYTDSIEFSATNQSYSFKPDGSDNPNNDTAQDQETSATTDEIDSHSKYQQERPMAAIENDEIILNMPIVCQDEQRLGLIEKSAGANAHNDSCSTLSLTENPLGMAISPDCPSTTELAIPDEKTELAKETMQQHVERMEIDDVEGELIKTTDVKGEENAVEANFDMDAPSQSQSQFDEFQRMEINEDRAISQSSPMIDRNEDEATQSSSIIPCSDEAKAKEPPTQSSDDSKADQLLAVSQSSYINSRRELPFNEISVQSHVVSDDGASLPTQSSCDANERASRTPGGDLPASFEEESSQERDIPSQSNATTNEEGIGTSTFSTNSSADDSKSNNDNHMNNINNDDVDGDTSNNNNNSIDSNNHSSNNNCGLNEEETASSSYVPETPETQERDQDQESAISTSSYEIPPCEEINIATSSVVPDTSIDIAENNLETEIPTSSHSLNPDSSSSTRLDSLPSSSYEDQIVIEQNVSTSFELASSMSKTDASSCENSGADLKNASTSYYSVNATGEVTSEPSQSYFVANEPSSPNCPSQNSASPTCYGTLPETEASQSFYSIDENATTTEQSSSTNAEATQSFYLETPDDVRFRSQQSEATPTCPERYSLDYNLENSPIETHDVVESSVPTTKSTEER